MLFGIVSQIMVQILIPVYFLYRLLTISKYSKNTRHIVALYSLLGTLYIFFTARWDITFLYLRDIWLALIIFAIVKAYFTKIEDKPSPQQTTSSYIFDVIFLVFVLVGCILALSGMIPPKDAVNIGSPLKGQNNYVAHGGGSTIINYHHTNKAQAYALDMGEINMFGHQESVSSKLSSYAIFGKNIYSPCDGNVVEVENKLKDLIPPEREKDKKNIAGNKVIIECDQDIKILLAHMKEKSVEVEKEQKVQKGQLLGKVGNTGNTTQPHLHIHAVQKNENILKGKGVPLTIDGKYLVRNSVF